MTDWDELIENAIHGFPAEEHCTALLSAITEVEKERDALKEAIDNIVNLGVQRLPVDKRWGTAFSIALETEKRLYRRS